MASGNCRHGSGVTVVKFSIRQNVDTVMALLAGSGLSLDAWPHRVTTFQDWN
jgi:hypothetical protein